MKKWPRIEVCLDVFFWGIMARSFSEIDGTANTAGGGKETVLSQDEREDKIASGID